MRTAGFCGPQLLQPPVGWLVRRGIPRGLAFTPLAADAAPAHRYAEVPARTGDKPDIFVMSIIGWDFRTQRPQHLATQMAAAGHRVFYLEMEQNQGEGTARDVAPATKTASVQ